jgi:dihydroflavonol-4-reductase
MKTLVTGSNGFIGSALVEKLLQQGHQVVCLVRKSSNLQWLQNLPVTFCYADLLSGAGLSDALQDVDWIFHLAGVTKAKERSGYLDGNVTATRQLLQACRHSQKFVYVSSQAAAGPSLQGRALTELDEPHPISIYGESKWLAEQEVHRHAQRLSVTIVRPPSVYGPRDRDIFVYFQNVNKGFLLVLAKGTQRISMVHVADLVDGLILAAENPTANGKTFYLCGDGEYDWLTIGRYIAQAMAKKTITLHVPYGILHVVSKLDMLFSSISGKPALLNKDKVREMVQPSWLCSNQRAKTELGFQPRLTAEQGLAATAAWYRQNHWL